MAGSFRGADRRQLSGMGEKFITITQMTLHYKHLHIPTRPSTCVDGFDVETKESAKKVLQRRSIQFGSYIRDDNTARPRGSRDRNPRHRLVGLERVVDDKYTLCLGLFSRDPLGPDVNKGEHRTWAGHGRLARDCWSMRAACSLEKENMQILLMSALEVIRPFSHTAGNGKRIITMHSQTVFLNTLNTEFEERSNSCNREKHEMVSYSSPGIAQDVPAT
ncbi:hypothetical protein BKA70DRAFT_1219212 [Coprinopsis sp. MPI-PUGE-AT-0042]|nr:hypothetical protein BKA70DRAFT_1219212 [Coprinopsis sp. MPI-PUGE-AT-0042]